MISPATSYGLSFSVQPTSTQANSDISAVTVQIVDKYGNPAALQSSIHLGLPSVAAFFVGSTRLTSTSLSTTTTGQAVFSNLQETKAGTYALVATATINSQSLSATSKSFVITPGPAVSMKFTSQPANGQYANSTLGATTGTVIVQLLDNYGNYVNQSNVPVTITIFNVTTKSTYGTQTTQVTNSLGQAVLSLMLSTAGTYDLIATSGSLTSSTSNPFIVTQAPQRWY